MSVHRVKHDDKEEEAAIMILDDDDASRSPVAPAVPAFHDEIMDTDTQPSPTRMMEIDRKDDDDPLAFESSSSSSSSPKSTVTAVSSTSSPSPQLNSTCSIMSIKITNLEAAEATSAAKPDDTTSGTVPADAVDNDDDNKADVVVDTSNTTNNTVVVNVAELPKRARSAYNYFFRAERAKLLGISDAELEAEKLQKRKHRKTPGMIGFANLASSVGKKWKMLSDEEKLPYQRMCIADRERYHRDLEEFRKKYGSNALLAASNALNGATAQQKGTAPSQNSTPSSAATEKKAATNKRRSSSKKKTAKTASSAKKPVDGTRSTKKDNTKDEEEHERKNEQHQQENSNTDEVIIESKSITGERATKDCNDAEHGEVVSITDQAEPVYPCLSAASTVSSSFRKDHTEVTEDISADSSNVDNASEASTAPQRRRRASRKQGNVAFTNKRKRQQEDAIRLVQEAKERELISETAAAFPADSSTKETQVQITSSSNKLEYCPSNTVSLDDASAAQYHSRSRSPSSCSMHDRSAAANQQGMMRMSVHSRSSSPHLIQHQFGIVRNGAHYQHPKFGNDSAINKVPFFEPIEPISIGNKSCSAPARSNALHLKNQENAIMDEGHPSSGQQSRDCSEQERLPTKRNSYQYRGGRWYHEEGSAIAAAQKGEKKQKHRRLEDGTYCSSEERCASASSSSMHHHEDWSSSSGVALPSDSSRLSPPTVGWSGTNRNLLRSYPPSSNPRYAGYYGCKKGDGREEVRFLSSKRMVHRSQSASISRDVAVAPQEADYLILSSEHYQAEAGRSGNRTFAHHRDHRRCISSDHGSRSSGTAGTDGHSHLYERSDYYHSAPPRSQFHQAYGHHVAHHLSAQVEGDDDPSARQHYKNQGENSRDLPTLKEWNLLLQNLA